MKITLEKIVILCIVGIALTIATSHVGSAQEYDIISGLSISLMGAPDSISAGEKITMQVKVSKPTGIVVQGRLRTYLYASTAEVTYPLPDPGFDYVPVCVGGWTPNEQYITLSEDSVGQIFDFEITLRDDVVFAGATAKAKLRARFRKYDLNVIIAPDSDKDVTLLPMASVEEGVDIPLELKAVLAIVVVVGMVAAILIIALKGRASEEASPWY